MLSGGRRIVFSLKENVKRMVKNKINLFFSIILMIIGISAVASFIILTVNNVFEWQKYILAVLLSVWFIVFGIRDIIKYIKSK